MIISLSGKEKSGKTTVADMICSIGAEMGISFTRASFAEVTREDFSRETGISVRMLTEDASKYEFKERMIEFEDEIRRENPKFFVEKFIDTLIPGQSYIIDDVEYIEELEAVVKLKGKPFKVEADMNCRRSRGWKPDRKTDAHPSQTEIADCCSYTFLSLGGGVIRNNRSIADLRTELTLLVKKEFLGVFTQCIQ